jgi:hypothetical protein
MDNEIMYIWPIGARCSRLIVELVNYFSDVVSIVIIIPIWKQLLAVNLLLLRHTTCQSHQ